MSPRSCAAILAIAVGLSTVSVAQAAQVANGLTINGKDAQGHLGQASSGTIRLKAVILQDGSTIELQ
jgi:Spy/CpxP family protein refolding chaperone